MSDYLVGLLTSSTVIGAIIALVNHWHKERLSSSIKHEYDLRMLAIQNQNAKAMEEIRTELKMQELKTQVRFSVLRLSEDLGSIGQSMRLAVISRLGDTEDGNNVLDLPPMKDFVNLGELLMLRD